MQLSSDDSLLTVSGKPPCLDPARRLRSAHGKTFPNAHRAPARGDVSRHVGRNPGTGGAGTHRERDRGDRARRGAQIDRVPVARFRRGARRFL